MRNGVLYISPSAEDASILSKMLGSVSIPLRRAENLRQARERLEGEPYGAVVTEAKLVDGSWKDVIEFVNKSGTETAVIVTNRFADGMFWADVLDLGAFDLLPQPFCSSEVQRIMANALHAPQLLRRAAPAA